MGFAPYDGRGGFSRTCESSGYSRSCHWYGYCWWLRQSAEIRTSTLVKIRIRIFAPGSGGCAGLFRPAGGGC